MRPRPLTAKESALLDALLSEDFDGVEALRVQAASVLARSGCSCGCGTIELVPQGDPPLSEAVSPVPVEGTATDGAGGPNGGLLLFVREGLLNSLEIYSFGEEPLPLPDPSRVTWSWQQQ